MSRVGLKEINIPDNVKVSLQDAKIIAEGPLGKLESGIHNTIEVKMDNMLIHSGNSMNINGKIINLSPGRYTKPKLFNYKDLIYISITDEKENKIYLYNNEGEMVNGFPLKGTNIVDIVDSDNDGKIELISQLDNNSVISYEIN